MQLVVRAAPIHRDSAIAGGALGSATSWTLHRLQRTQYGSKVHHRSFRRGFYFSVAPL